MVYYVQDQKSSCNGEVILTLGWRCPSPTIPKILIRELSPGSGILELEGVTRCWHTGGVAPSNHPQFRAINCCQLRIGSCRPDLCRILGAFLHFPDNPNCGSPVICGGGKPPPPHCARLRNVYTGTIIYRHCLVGRDRENTKQKPPPHCAQLCNVYNSRQGHDKRYYQGRDRENTKQTQTQAWQ